ncbi:MAG TPA: hypothetical protein ENK19_01180 [Acidobacteria bacterium]|nr:hypothetical protein [Acidobacteriota bacterium]
MEERLPSGVRAWFDPGSFRRFGRDEWPYYDGIPDRDPMRILPDDVQVTVSMNSFVNTADKVRAVHQGLRRRWEHLLREVPPDADLATFDPDLVLAREFFDAACTLPGILLATATKVLHRKRPRWMPMIDSVVIDAYCDAAGRSGLKAVSQEGGRAAGVGVFVLDRFRRDLLSGPRGLTEVREAAASIEAPMTPVRALEVAVWMANEPRGYYRS